MDLPGIFEHSDTPPAEQESLRLKNITWMDEAFYEDKKAQFLKSFTRTVGIPVNFTD